MKHTLPLAAIVGTLLALSAWVTARTSSDDKLVTITLYVLNSQNEAVSGAIIEVEANTSKGKVPDKPTDKRGRYTFEVPKNTIFVLYIYHSEVGVCVCPPFSSGSGELNPAIPVVLLSKKPSTAALAYERLKAIESLAVHALSADKEKVKTEVITFLKSEELLKEVKAFPGLLKYPPEVKKLIEANASTVERAL